MHFREGRKNVLRSVQKIVLAGSETRRAAVRPKQNQRSPPGGGKDPKQCPVDGREMEPEFVCSRSDHSREEEHGPECQRSAGLLLQME